MNRKPTIRLTKKSVWVIRKLPTNRLTILEQYILSVPLRRKRIDQVTRSRCVQMLVLFFLLFHPPADWARTHQVARLPRTSCVEAAQLNWPVLLEQTVKFVIMVVFQMVITREVIRVVVRVFATGTRAAIVRRRQARRLRARMGPMAIHV